jgi:hypothetical protein
MKDMDIIQVNDNRIVKAFRFIKNYFSGNTHESAQCAPFGDDSCPIKGVNGLKTITTTSALQIVIGYFNKNPKALAGEKRLYSVKPDGSISFEVWFKNDGTIEIGGNTDNLMGYTEMKKAFDQLKSDLNDFITVYNAHVHPVSGASTTAPGTLGTASKADMSKAKINAIKTL